jgi:hypothetical protein
MLSRRDALSLAPERGSERDERVGRFEPRRGALERADRLVDERQAFRAGRDQGGGERRGTDWPWQLRGLG